MDILKCGLFRRRNVYLGGGSLLAIALLLFTDPDGGSLTALFGISLVVPVIAVWFSHFMRKGLLDYPEADMRLLFKSAGRSSVGSGLALVAIAILMSALLGLFGRSAHAESLGQSPLMAQPAVMNLPVAASVAPAHGYPLPVQAQAHLGTLWHEVGAVWPGHPEPWVLAGLIEHESCITVKHPKCWNPKSMLKTSREEGAGLGQLTRAYSPNGALRFDALAEMKQQHPSLRELNWGNIYDRPDLQIRALVLKSKQDHRNFEQTATPLHFTDAAYNEGVGGVNQDRRLCKISSNCNPTIWFNNVELTCSRSKTPIYGGRSACDISRHHVRDVMLVKSPKYKAYYESYKRSSI